MRRSSLADDGNKTVAQGLGRPVIGLSSDAVGRLNIANLSTLWCGLLCLFIWTFGARTLAGCIVFALLSGSVAGVMWATVSPICAEVVGLALIPSGEISSLFTLTSSKIGRKTDKKNPP
jgi:hypothetical protein